MNPTPSTNSSRPGKLARLVVLAMLITSLQATGASWAGAADCTVSITPSSAAIGAGITVSGSGWSANDTVYVNIGGIQVTTVSADGAGDFSTGATVPALANGDHNVFASNFAADCEVSATFTVTDPPPPTPPPDDCSISASPSVADIGQQVTLIGDQWGPGRQVYVNLGGIQIAVLTASSSGAVSGSATVPALPDGPQLLFAFDGPAECEVSSSVEIGAPATTTTTTAAPTTTAEPTTTTVAPEPEPDDTTTTAAPQPDDTTTTAAPEPDDTTTTTDTAQPDETTTTDTPESDDDASGFGLLPVLLALGAVAALTAFLLARRRSDQELPANESADTGPRRDLDSP